MLKSVLQVLAGRFFGLECAIDLFHKYRTGVISTEVRHERSGEILRFVDKKISRLRSK